MDIFIPLHQSCSSIDEHGIFKVLNEKPSDNSDTYLILRTTEHPIELKIGQGGGHALAKEALHYAERLNRDDSPQTDAESYTARGQEIAESIHFGSAIEYLAAWLNEDRKQASFCRDIHAVLALDILDKLPRWIRYDLLSILESEAMKQIFAQRYFIEAKREGYKIPGDLKSALQDSADKQTETVLSILMSEAMQTPPRYSNNTAEQFVKKAQNRLTLFESLEHE